MGIRRRPERDSDRGSLREGHFKEPVEGLIVYWLLYRVDEAVVVDTGGVIGTIEALLLWIVVAYVALTMYDIGHGRVEQGEGPEGARNYPDRNWGFGLTALGVIALGLVATYGIEPISEWVTSVVLGPGEGVPVETSGAVVMLWVIIGTVAAESLSRGLDKLIVRYVGQARQALARRRVRARNQT